jgi:hypothetical protein
MASFTPIILFGVLIVLAFYMGGTAMDEAAKNRKQQS